MQTIDHGLWQSYQPDPPPEGVPTNVMFARRDSDGADWYEYILDSDHFSAGNVVIAAYWVAGQNAYVVGPATREPAAIFPQNCIVHELTDYSGSDPQADLGDKCFDPATGTFTDLAQPESSAQQNLFDKLDMIMVRLDALEKKS